MNSLKLLIPWILLFGISCSIERKKNPDLALALSLAANSDSLQLIAEQEAIADSIELANALMLQSEFQVRLQAVTETVPVESPEGEDAADDPAIWYNSDAPSKSLVLGTDKNAGVYVYDLNGRLVQTRKVGRINNIDLRDGFSWGEKNDVLVAGSNRSNNAITLMMLDTETGLLSDSLANIASGVDEVYGICCYKSKVSGELYVFVNGKGGGLEQWRISGKNDLRADLLRSLTLTSQPEGMVADDQEAFLYVGVEEEGIYRMHAEPDADTLMHLLPGSDSLNPRIKYDVEGLALFSWENKKYLMASSQGNFSYALLCLRARGAI
jgi:3-phytase